MKSSSDRRRFGWLSVALAVNYLIVGWWPFEFRPLNQVSWLPDRAGLRFQDDGLVYDPEPLPAAKATELVGPPVNFTVELWVEADVKPATDVFHLLTIHDGRLPSPFVLCQWQKAIILRAATRDSLSVRKIHEVGVAGALVEHAARLITVTGSGAGTDFYLDGAVVRHFPEFTVGPEVLNGRLVLGNAAAGKHSWVGRFFGLAVYHRALGAEEIARHYSLWTQGQARQIADVPNLAALYLFDERSGQQVNDHSTNRHQLVIPAIYEQVQKEFLIPPWADVSYDTLNYQDIVVNVLGFAPFGFCLFLHRRRVEGASRFADALFVIVAGGAISLTIETIQVWLPNRVSSMTDLLGNTAGTLLGVLVALAIRPKVTTAETVAKSVE